MDGIFFLVLAFLVAFSSIKLSYYGDTLSKSTKLGTAFIGGLLIASITSLPELVTSVSAVLVNNPYISFGDILGSNMFNVFVLSIFNIWFFKQDFFNSVSKKYLIECLILITEYILIIFISSTLLTILLLFMYVFYILRILKNDEETSNNTSEKHVLLKFILCSVLLIGLSILLTLEADNITHIYPKISSSSVGAILLGITTSLPEVVSTYTLLKLGNNNMAISNMLGSNIFNFLILSVSDFFVKKDHIYSYSDKYSNMYLYGGLIVTFLLFICIYHKKMTKKCNIMLSLLISLIYLIVWYFQFK